MPSTLFPSTITQQVNQMTTPTPQLINTMVNPNQQLQGQTPQNNQEEILKVWNLIKNSGDPNQAMTTIMNQNPEFKKAVEAINMLGNPEKLFYERAKQKGVDPNSIISLLK